MAVLPDLLRRRLVPSLLAGLVGPAALLTAAAGPAAAVAPAAGGVHTLVTPAGLCLDVTNGATGNGALLQQWGCNGHAAQQFRWHDAGGGRYKLHNLNSTRCVDVPASTTADGARLIQWRCIAGAANQAFTATASSGGSYTLRNAASGKCVAVAGGSTTAGAAVVQQTCTDSAAQRWTFTPPGGGTPTTPTPTTPTPTTPTAPGGLVGWAAQNGGTTGGGSAAATTVTSASALTAALSGTAPKVVRISGLLTVSGMVRVPSNTTIQGVGANSGIRGGGLTVRDARNVIIRNLVFRNAADDSINVENSTNVWVDHNDLAQAYDGLIDVKRGSDHVTISWNRLHDHDKSMLLGHSDSNGSQDTGKLRVTYHHNWLNGTGQRHPRVRFGNPVHVYNNLYSNIRSYGVASTENAGVLVERNVFENVADPFHRGEGSSGPGGLVARENLLVNSGAGQTGGSVAAIPYRYAADPASAVKAAVTSGAGTGRLGL